MLCQKMLRTNFYSFFKVSIGFNLAARLAGNIPKNSPIMNENRNDVITTVGETTGVTPINRQRATTLATPIIIPTSPPIVVSTIDSIRNKANHTF